jgi:hypothetical protein
MNQTCTGRCTTNIPCPSRTGNNNLTGLASIAKVELWGTSFHIKQLAEIYNDNGQKLRPMEYPIEVVVEPVAQRRGGMAERLGLKQEERERERETVYFSVTHTVIIYMNELVD